MWISKERIKIEKGESHEKYRMRQKKSRIEQRNKFIKITMDN